MTLLLSACSPGDLPADRSQETVDGGGLRQAESRAGPKDLTYPILIGQDGPRFRACASVGLVAGLGDDDRLEVRTAPFESASVTDALENGRRIFICMRSLDQKWFGAVYPGERQDAAQCGVLAPVSAQRAYEGPCRSGWVASSAVRLVAG